MTEDKYWYEVQALSNEIDMAISIYYVYEEMHNLAAQNRLIFDVLNANADFWATCSYALQASLFTVLARIFDESPDAHSIHRVLNATMQHPEFFSREALAARKRAEGLSEYLLDAYMKHMIWVPSSSRDLRLFKRELAPYTKKFKEVYQPIRHCVIAHRVVDIDSATMFSLTNRQELGEILRFLDILMQQLKHLYQNGRQPEVRLKPDEEIQYPASKSVHRVLEQLAAQSPRFDAVGLQEKPQGSEA